MKNAAENEVLLNKTIDNIKEGIAHNDDYYIIENLRIMVNNKGLD